MIVVITGSRTWTNESAIKTDLMLLVARYGYDNLRVIVGYDPIKQTPRGVDRMAYKWCKSLGINVTPEPAKWDANGYFDRGAGFKRNILMLDQYGPNLVLAYRAEGKSNGTDHCIKEARKRGIKVEVRRESDGGNA